MAKRNNSINKTLAMTLIFSGAVLIILAFVLMRVENIIGWIGSLLSILRPVFIGIALTFILYGPTVKLTHLLEKATKGKRFPCNGIAVLLSYLLFFGIVTGLVCIVVPSFISSIEEFADKFSSYIFNIQLWFTKTMAVLSDGSGFDIMEELSKNANAIFDQLSGIVSALPDQIPDLIETVGGWASNIAGIMSDIIFGIAFSVYMLAGRTKLKRQAKRIVKTFFQPVTYNRISHMTNLFFNTFSNFVSGQLIEALIMGLLCFIGMTILGFPYAVMISVIIGVTNIIPIIGPIIGTVPGAVIYLMIDPWRSIWFIIFVIILQQIESNLIYPRVVGSSVGLPAIWILFAVTVGGGLFDIMGMIIGVPLMSIIYTVLREKTAAAAAEEEVPKDNRPPMFPGVGEKTSAAVSKVRNSLQSGIDSIMDKINDRIHKKETVADISLDEDEDDKQEHSDIEKALDELEKSQDEE